MTNLTFAELTALIAVNGLTVNDRYYITDKNWTIIAITTNSYRIVVPIVTEVTKAELDALVAANGLNEGLQYHVIDDDVDWLLLANSNNTLISIKGYLLIPLSYSFPEYIDCSIILIDSGLFSSSGRQYDSGEPFNIESIPDFYLYGVYYKDQTGGVSGTALTITNDSETILIQNFQTAIDAFIISTVIDSSISLIAPVYHIWSDEVGEGENERIYLEIHKSKI